ncbi:hypothetical protein D6C84_06540 [Aureobasidium pullulans]|uniref:Uncharacterized protein n=1 Tax=Aureobasidium pullulans TaxID=5580 RepID=A0A4S9XTJ3_AURPU|nr:hypothetical protein D6C84_06540 [Aureobasidium pullulans]
MLEMHNILKIALVVHRKPPTITLSMDGRTDFKTIVHFYNMRVTKSRIHGGGTLVFSILY